MGINNCKFTSSKKRIKVVSRMIRFTLKRLRAKVKEERMTDALALGGEEGRGKLRKAAGIRKQELIRRSPNGKTRRR